MDLSSVTKFATSGLKGKLHLYLDYALILAVVLLAGFVLWGKVRTATLETTVATLNGKLTSANDRVAAVEAVNKSQAEAITTISAIRAQDSVVLSGLVKDLGTIYSRDQRVAVRLTALEKSNEEVRKWLHAPVPSTVGCVLDKTCEAAGPGDSVAGPADPAARTVPPSVPRTVKK
jgi:hypothetical protein